MVKAELVTKISEETGATKKDTEAFLKAFENVVVDTVANGDKIQLTGFLSIEQTVRKARTGVNPATQEKIEIPETKAVKVKVGKSFKDAVKNS